LQPLNSPQLPARRRWGNLAAAKRLIVGRIDEVTETKGLKMSRRSLLAEPAPVNAERYKTLAWVAHEICNRPALNIWFGKSQNPKRYYFRSAENRDRYIESQKLAADEAERSKIRRTAERDQSQAAMSAQLQVGTMLVNSWGYDQTNIDFYQIVRRTDRSVWIRPIGCRQVEGSEGFMCDKVMPARDSFKNDDPPIRKTIGPHGIAMDCGGCRITAINEQHYRSWYA
jgi:hypothetical protein